MAMFMPDPPRDEDRYHEEGEMNRCCSCDRPLNERSDKIYTEVTGWDTKRDAGGPNVVHLRKPTGKIMCQNCMTLLLSGVSTEQASLV